MSAIVIGTPDVAAQINQVQARALPVPKGITLGDTSNFGAKFFHCAIFGATNSGKTSLASGFAGPDDTRIILTRNKSQLIPLENQGYQFALVTNASDLLYALLYPERLWPEWAERPGRALVLDDLTEAAEMCVEANRISDTGREVRNNMLVYRGVKEDMRSIFRACTRRPQHVIFTALVRIGRDNIRNIETIRPDVSDSIASMFGAEIEYSFYIDDRHKKLLTESEIVTVSDPGDIDPATRAPRIHRREIVVKSKQPNNLPRILSQREEMDLRAIWNKIQRGEGKNA